MIGLASLLIAGLFACMAYSNGKAEKAAVAVCAAAVPGQSLSAFRKAAASYPNARLDDFEEVVQFTAGGFGMYRTYCRVRRSGDVVASKSLEFVYE